MNQRQQHWDTVYRDKDHTRVSWFQEDCRDVVQEILKLELAKDEPILDVGGGASRLVDALLGEGFSNLHVLDIAAGGMAIAQERLGEQADEVNWICADITKANLPSKIALWHDRAAFHFLTNPEDQQAYVAQMRKYMAPEGFIMLSTFAIDGPTKCSDLIVEQYDADKILATLGSAFELLHSSQQVHKTPGGSEQLFQHCLLKFKG